MALRANLLDETGLLLNANGVAQPSSRAQKF